MTPAAFEIIPMPDITTIDDRSTWVTVDDGKTFTHPGIPGWELTPLRTGRIAVAGLTDGLAERICTVANWDQAIETIAYMHGA